MASEQNHDEAEVLAARALIRVPPDRLTALAAGIAGMRRPGETMLKHDYGTAEPASRFRPPPP